MNSQRSASTFGEHFKIAARLRCFHYAETVLLPRHRQVMRVLASDLQEDSGIRPTFIRLTRRMQKARTETETRCHLFRVAYGVSGCLQNLLVFTVHLDVGEECAVIMRLQAIQMRFQIGAK